LFFSFFADKMSWFWMISCRTETHCSTYVFTTNFYTAPLKWYPDSNKRIIITVFCYFKNVKRCKWSPQTGYQTRSCQTAVACFSSYIQRALDQALSGDTKRLLYNSFVMGATCVDSLSPIVGYYKFPVRICSDYSVYEYLHWLLRDVAKIVFLPLRKGHSTSKIRIFRFEILRHHKRTLSATFFGYLAKKRDR